MQLGHAFAQEHRSAMLLPTWSIVFHKSSALRAMPMPPGWLSAKKIERVPMSALVKMS